jgi:hypothetical protein
VHIAARGVDVKLNKPLVGFVGEFILDREPVVGASAKDGAGAQRNKPGEDTVHDAGDYFFCHDDSFRIGVDGWESDKARSNSGMTCFGNASKAPRRAPSYSEEEPLSARRLYRDLNFFSKPTTPSLASIPESPEQDERTQRGAATRPNISNSMLRFLILRRALGRSGKGRIRDFLSKVGTWAWTLP